MASPVFADAIRPTRPVLARSYDVALIAGFSLVIALGAQVAIPLPFTPVPVTLQTLAVLLAGFLLGSTRGALAVVVYLGEGFAGLPVFSGGTSGITHLLGPTGGYLVGFLAGAWAAGFCAERGAGRNWLLVAASLVVADLVIYVPGVLWLAAFTGLGKAIGLGFVPFVVGDALKTVAGTGLLAGAGLFTGRTRASRP